MLNHIDLMGRLVANPELRHTQNQIPVASFRIAVDRDYGGRDGQEKQTDFINIVAWRSTAEFVNKYFTKGSMIAVSGRLQIREYTDRNNVKQWIAEVVADNVYFGESKRSRDEAAGGYNNYGGGNSGGGNYGGSYGGGNSGGNYGGGNSGGNYGGGNSGGNYGAPSDHGGSPLGSGDEPDGFSELSETADGELPF